MQVVLHQVAWNVRLESVHLERVRLEKSVCVLWWCVCVHVCVRRLEDVCLEVVRLEKSA